MQDRAIIRLAANLLAATLILTGAMLAGMELPAAGMTVIAIGTILLLDIAGCFARSRRRVTVAPVLRRRPPPVIAIARARRVRRRVARAAPVTRTDALASGMRRGR
jgi:hypothetical protein